MSTSSIYVALKPGLYPQLFSESSTAALRQLGDVQFQQESELTSRQLADRIHAHDIVVTSWGTPRFTDDVLAASERLKLIAHAAGSIKWLLPENIFDGSVTVTNAAAAMVQSVSETTLMFILMLLRRPHQLDRKMRTNRQWDDLRADGMGRELRHTRVGVVGAGMIGRSVIHMLRALQVEVWVYDPFLQSAIAEELGASKVSLEDLLTQCPVITLHAPSTPETHHMIGAHELKMLQDGAMLINTARSWLIDGDALLAELESKRISAALDVFDQEPLPQNHPLLALNNVILTPHIGSLTTDAFHRQGQIAVEEIERFVKHQPLRHRVTKAMLATMA